MIRTDKGFDATAFMLALSLQLAPSMPTTLPAPPIDADVAWRHYGRLVQVGIATGGRVLDAVRAIG
ncbi:hypothetical protein GGQ80_002859 [Sphingomonas jinjuensis]|uniref:Uncharacterized protein n=1 Tax=Sphingomonas jinjuensis TaxID=535907 RepID=A0A840F6P1_9SPHN|nr:hypothetical protein [Sphingomonas jinjuensis]MBB4154943.1 hypothetical protein [Sphingomonas jinjuensis]